MSDSVFRLFVYGTLKRGYWNHECFCGEAVSIEPGRVLGQLYELPSGIPVLEVPEDTIIAVGSGDVCEDAALQRTVAPEENPHSQCMGSWRWVEGEVIILPDAHRTIPSIDQLGGLDLEGLSL